MKRLSNVDRAYVIQLIKLIREATQQCSKASAEWNKANDEFNDWYDRNFHVKFPADRDPLHYLKIKQVNIALNSAFDTWHFWQREVMRLNAAIEAEKSAREMMEWGNASGPDDQEAAGEWDATDRAIPRSRGASHRSA